MTEKRQRPEDQLLPIRSEAPLTHDLVKEDMEVRKKLGISRYGLAHQANNGRDTLRDLYEEILDAACYCRALLYERDGK